MDGMISAPDDKGRASSDRWSGIIPRYAASLDFEDLWRRYPPAPDYLETTHKLGRDELTALQETRFLEQMRRGWAVPFYRRHWGSVGLEAGDIRGLADLKKIPPYSVSDLRESIDRNPPWGDYIGIDPETDTPLPLILQTSGGTTGMPRPMLFAPQDREVMNIITGRRLHMQGVRPFDLVQVTLSAGLTNGGLLAREGIWKYSGAVPVMTGPGSVTPSRRQIEILKHWKCKALIGFPAYLRHLAFVAKNELGLEPRDLGVRSLISHLGTDDRSILEDVWGADAFDTYGTNECGTIAADCSAKNGMHVFEDAFVAEINNPDTLKPVVDDERGTVFLTALFKYAAPVIRFNTNDVSAFCSGSCSCGGTHQRLARIYGRSDNMVKLRGVNLFPEAIGSLIVADGRTNGEYVCIVETDGERDEMRVLVELNDIAALATVEKELAGRLKEALGVKLPVEAVERGVLAPMTGLDTTSKIKRLIDRRKKP